MFWKRKPKPRINDPLFGELTLEEFGWTGTMPAPANAGTLYITIKADEAGPEEAQRAAFSDALFSVGVEGNAVSPISLDD